MSKLTADSQGVWTDHKLMTNLAPHAKAVVADFAEVAAAYCALLDHRPSANDPALVLAECLARLHLVALRLPDVADDDGPEPGPSPKPLFMANWTEILPIDGYWDIFDPLSVEPEPPVLNSLVDDLGDIYGDLKSGLELYDGGFPLAAAWHWRFGYLSHWGEHLVGAQRALYLAARR
jgi:hypothetical protein